MRTLLRPPSTTIDTHKAKSNPSKHKSEPAERWQQRGRNRIKPSSPQSRARRDVGAGCCPRPLFCRHVILKQPSHHGSQHKNKTREKRAEAVAPHHGATHRTRSIVILVLGAAGHGKFGANIQSHSSTGPLPRPRHSRGKQSAPIPPPQAVTPLAPSEPAAVAPQRARPQSPRRPRPGVRQPPPGDAGAAAVAGWPPAARAPPPSRRH